MKDHIRKKFGNLAAFSFKSTMIAAGLWVSAGLADSAIKFQWNRGAKEVLTGFVVQAATSNLCTAESIDGASLPFEHSLYGYFNKAGTLTVERSGILANMSAPYTGRYFFVVAHTDEGKEDQALVLSEKSRCPVRTMSPIAHG